MASDMIRFKLALATAAILLTAASAQAQSSGSGDGSWDAICSCFQLARSPYTQPSLLPVRVPEPASLAVLGIGLTCLAAVRRRHRSWKLPSAGQGY